MNNEINSIGLNKKPSDTTVVVAMSGGVDSSTVAGMMKKQGYKVIGITLKLYDDAKEVAKSKQCCSGQDIMDAKRVAQKLNIDLGSGYPSDPKTRKALEILCEEEVLADCIRRKWANVKRTWNRSHNRPIQTRANEWNGVFQSTLDGWE